jgi:hypothetical protein
MFPAYFDYQSSMIAPIFSLRLGGRTFGRVELTLEPYMLDTLIREPDLLESDDTIAIPAPNAPFIPNASFTTKNRKVRISMVWEEFRKRFFDETAEMPTSVSLRKYKLLRPSPDAPIIEALGGESAVETSVASVFAMMERQPLGQAGALQVNGYANIFYVRDKDGVLCAVRVGWDGEGWIIDAIPVNDPLAWNGQHQIFCSIA